MKWKKFLSSYFHLSKKERTGVLVIIVIICGLFFMTPVYESSQTDLATADTSWIAIIEKQRVNVKTRFPENHSTDQYKNNQKVYAGNSQGKINSRVSLFNFDPNTLDEKGWQQLGLRPRTIGTILNFRSKGGKFRKPGDLQKIYGLFPDEYARIAPFVRIPNDISSTLSAAPIHQNNFVKNPTPSYGNVDINLSDTSALIALPGIGSKLANRIIIFREKLGGFYSIDQVAETFGLADSIFKKIRAYFVIGNTSVKKISINAASIDELKSHPYIRYTLANPIIAYRSAHGNFQKVSDLRNIMAITDAAFEKMLPYLDL